MTGKNYLKKVKDLAIYLNNNKIDVVFLSASENIAWLLNIRGEDSEFSPLPNSYLLVDKKMNIFYFVNLKRLIQNSKILLKL